ncbi:MAG: hypothetical protein H8D84_01180 [Proteobacteria bacterium]|nr:hypothetical protein [Pseudomonadota bacterium]
MKNTILFEEMFKNKISCFYPSKNEVSLLKKIDIKHLDFFKTIIKQNKLKIRIRYRGKSHPFQKRLQSFCHMNIATSFALYLR